VLSLVYPATSQGPADLATVPGTIGLDWFYLPAFPLIETLPGPVTWTASLAFLIIMVAIPWLPPMKKAAPAVVNLDNCNGCGRCAADCPYTAITMQLRSDGKPFEGEAVVDPSLCVSCGICAGSCPTSTPFRRMSHLVPGIDLPDRPIISIRDDTEAEARRISGPARILVYGCINSGTAEALRSQSVGVIPVNCTGHLPPSFVDYVLSRNLADGVVISGCTENSCYNRFGVKWTGQRIAGIRDPHLRKRVPRDRLRTVFAGRLGGHSLARELADFATFLENHPKTGNAPAADVLHKTEKQDA